MSGALRGTQAVFRLYSNRIIKELVMSRKFLMKRDEPRRPGREKAWEGVGLGGSRPERE